MNCILCQKEMKDITNKLGNNFYCLNHIKSFEVTYYPNEFWQFAFYLDNKYVIVNYDDGIEVFYRKNKDTSRNFQKTEELYRIEEKSISFNNEEEIINFVKELFLLS